MVQPISDQENFPHTVKGIVHQILTPDSEQQCSQTQNQIQEVETKSWHGSNSLQIFESAQEQEKDRGQFIVEEFSSSLQPIIGDNFFQQSFELPSVNFIVQRESNAEFPIEQQEQIVPPQLMKSQNERSPEQNFQVDVRSVQLFVQELDNEPFSLQISQAQLYQQQHHNNSYNQPTGYIYMQQFFQLNRNRLLQPIHLAQILTHRIKKLNIEKKKVSCQCNARCQKTKRCRCKKFNEPCGSDCGCKNCPVKIKMRKRKESSSDDEDNYQSHQKHELQFTNIQLTSGRNQTYSKR